MHSPDIVAVAFARAWSVYRLIHSGIDDTELLAVAGLKYLKGLEGIPEG